MRSPSFRAGADPLFLVASPIGNLGELSPRAAKAIEEADVVACEDTRVTGKLLAHLKIKKTLISLREHNERSQALNVVDMIKEGKRVVYLSDAGMPGISDPGEILVRTCLESGVDVSTISGPSAFVNALVASGLPTRHFYFHGFLDPREKARRREILSLKRRKETLVFYEAPHRIERTLKDLHEILGDRKACLARELTKRHEEYVRAGLKELSGIDPATLKGEMVLVVEGSDDEEQSSLSDEEIASSVRKCKDQGLKTMEAVRKVAAETGLAKNRVYRAYQSLSAKGK